PQQQRLAGASPAPIARHLEKLTRPRLLQTERDDRGAAAHESAHQLDRRPAGRAVHDGIDAARERAHGCTITKGCATSPRPDSKESEVAEKKDEIPVQYLDRRVVERYIKKGLLDEKEYHRRLKALDDLAEKAGTVETAFTSVGELGPTR